MQPLIWINRNKSEHLPKHLDSGGYDANPLNSIKDFLSPHTGTSMDANKRLIDILMGIVCIKLHLHKYMHAHQCNVYIIMAKLAEQQLISCPFFAFFDLHR